MKEEVSLNTGKISMGLHANDHQCNSGYYCLVSIYLHKPLHSLVLTTSSH